MPLAPEDVSFESKITIGVGFNSKILIKDASSKATVQTGTPEFVAFFPSKDLSGFKLYPITKIEKDMRYVSSTGTLKNTFRGAKAVDPITPTLTELPGKPGYYSLTFSTPLQNGEYVFLPSVPTQLEKNVTGWTFAVRKAVVQATQN